MTHIVKLLFTHNFNYEKVENYIRAFKKIEGTIQNPHYKLEYQKLSYEESQDELEQYAKDFKCLILTGGLDVNPTRYNEKPHLKTKIMSDKKEKIDFLLIEYFIKHKKSILGICLGCQQLNVFFGGTLYQDISDELGSFIHEGRNNEETNHEVIVERNSILSKLIELDKFEIVSHHHQAIKKLGKGLKINSYSPTDNIIEGIEYIDFDNCVLGIQWHPERDIEKSKASINLFKNFTQKLIEFDSLMLNS